MPFLTPSWAVESTPGAGVYRLTRSPSYEGKHETFTVPEGFETDYATVPRIFTWLLARDGIHTLPAILHDWLCTLAYAGLFSRRDADGIFRRRCARLGSTRSRGTRCGPGCGSAGCSGRCASSAGCATCPRASSGCSCGIGAVLAVLFAIPAMLAGVAWAGFAAVGWVAGRIERRG